MSDPTRGGMLGGGGDIFANAIQQSQTGAPAAPATDPKMNHNIPPDFLVAVMAMQKKIASLREEGEHVTSADMDEYLKAKTAGKYGLTDYRKLQTATGDNMLRSVANGISFNQMDNILGLFSKTAANESRARTEAYRELHPMHDMVGSLLGAVVTGKGLDDGAVSLLGEPRTIAQTAKVGAAVGGLYGGVDAAGRADDADAMGKLKTGVEGALAGGVAGGVVGGVVGGISRILRPQNNAVNRVTAAIAKDGGIEQVRDRLREFVDAGRGAEVTLADLGPHVAKALDFAANESDDVFVPVAKLLKARTAERAARLLADVRANSGAPARLAGEAPNISPSAARAGESDFQLRARQLEANTSSVGNKVFGDLAEQNPNFDTSTLPLDKPKIARLYEQARLAGNLKGGGPLDELIQTLTKHNPAMNPAEIQQAAKTIMSASTRDAAESGMAPAFAPKGERPVSLQELMQLRRAVEGQASSAFKNGNGPLGNAMADIKTHIGDVLEEGAPGYKAANTAYKGANDLERGLELGHDWWLKADSRELGRVVEGLKNQPGALDEFRRGIASGLIEKLQGTASNRDAARELLQASGDLDAKLKLIFGDTQTFKSFMKRVAAERSMSELANTIGGSPTSRRIAARGLTPEELGIDAAVRGPGTLTRAAGAAARAATMKRTANAMGPMLLTHGAPNIEAFLHALGADAQPLARPGTIAMPTTGLLNLIPKLFSTGQ